MEKLVGKVTVIFISEGDKDFVVPEDRVIHEISEKYRGVSMPGAMDILQREKGLQKEHITKNGEKSFILDEKIKKGER